MKQVYKEPEYYTFPLLSNKLGIAQMQIEIDFKTGKIIKFLIDNLNTKSSPNTRKRIYKLLPILNQYAREHLADGPSAILCQYGLKRTEIDKSRLKYLIVNIDKDEIFELWLREYGIDINNIKIVIPRDEAIRYEEYLKGITNEMPVSNTAFDVKEYVTQIRTEKGCKHKSCYKCDNKVCRNKLAYEIVTQYGDHTPHGVTLCDIGVAMGCPEPPLAKNKEDENQMELYKKKKNRVKSQVKRWKAAHGK